MQRYTVYLFVETALHVSGGTSTHHQEHTQLHLQHLVHVKLLLLPAAMRQVAIIVRPVPDALDTVVCVLLMMGGDTTRNMYSSFRI